MSITVADLTALNPLSVTQQLDVIAQMVQEFNPTIDVKRGVLHDLLLYTEAVLAVATQTNIDRYNRARSLAEIIADPALADDDIVNSVLSFYRISRLPGSVAAGRVTFVTDSQDTFTIPSGEKFSANGQIFTTTTVYTTHDDPALVITSNDRYLKPQGDGTYAFEIPVEAVAVGVAGRLRKNTLLTTENVYDSLIKIYASSDFSGGEDIESNAKLLDRLLSGVAAQCLSNRLNMDALLRAQPGFETTVATSIIGMGDAEMLRDKHWIWPSGGGGRIDWYVRRQEQVQFQTLPMTATVREIIDTSTSRWEILFDRDALPGFYDIVNVLPATADASLGGYLVTTDNRMFDVSGDGEPTPDIVNAAEGAYSRFQTAQILFTDTDTLTAGLVVDETQKTYNVTARLMPGIDAVQAFVGSRRVRAAAADVLVRAPVPCFVDLSFTVQRRATDASPDTAAIAQQLAKVVNTYGFTGRLPASLLAETIHSFLPSTSAISAIDMRGTIRRPDGTIKPLRSSEVLIVPTEPDKMVTARTVAFYLDPLDVAIAVEVVAMPEI